MPEWQADALILASRAHGEGSAVVSVFTAENGRHAGLVRGGMSARMRAVLQPGNRVRARWRARLPEQLGQLQLEPVQAVSAALLDDSLRLAGLAAACALLESGLPEREAQPGLFHATNALLDLICMEDPDNRWLEGYIRWELGLLEAAGFRLDLSRCAATGGTQRLAYVSPRSGCAVAEGEAGEFASRMLTLPAFLGGVACQVHDYPSGLAMTGHFLERRVFATYHQDIPSPRRRFAEMVGGIYGGLTV